MDNYRFGDRLRHIYRPILVVSAAFVATYMFLDWLLTIQTRILPLDDDLVGIWLPMGLPIIPIYLWLYRPLRGLELSDSILFYYCVALVAGMTAPMMLTHSYLKSETGTLTHVAHASELGSAADTQYYSVDDLCFTKKDASYAPDFEVNRNTLYVRLYVVAPLCTAQSPAAAGRRVAWIGMMFYDDISYTFSKDEVDKKYRAFVAQTLKKFSALDVTSYTYLKQVGHDRRDQKAFQSALEKNPRYRSSSPVMILIPQEGIFETRSRGAFTWMFLTAGIVAIAWLTMFLIPRPNIATLDALKSRVRLNPEEKTESLSTLFVPTHQSYALPLLLDLNVLVFLAMMFSGLGFFSFRHDDLLDWGANYGPFIKGFGVFRLVTSEFVHTGSAHLANNCFALMIAGTLLRPVIGNGSLIAAYLLSGIGANLAGILIHPTTVSVGASGAIMGLFGIMVALLWTRDEHITAQKAAIAKTAMIFISANLILGFLTLGIDNAAHIGGLLTGVVLGLLLHLVNTRMRDYEVRNT